MQAILYDSTFDGFLCAVFDVYYYKFADPFICKEEEFKGNIFEKVHYTVTNEKHAKRIWEGLRKKLSAEGLHKVYQTFLSQLPNIENVLFQFVQYAFNSALQIENDYGHPAVLAVHQTAKKVHREKHRMEAFVRFQQTADNLYYAIIEPDYHVLPLIAVHFKDRFADQQWMIWDARRKCGLYYNLDEITEVTILFEPGLNNGRSIEALITNDEVLYQQLWQQYFKSVNITARNNKKLQLQHMPVRYWKYLPEKRIR